MSEPGVSAQFTCCGNDAWVHEDKELPPCPTCGTVWIGREYVHEGITYIDAIRKEAEGE